MVSVLYVIIGGSIGNGVSVGNRLCIAMKAFGHIGMRYVGILG